MIVVNSEIVFQNIFPKKIEQVIFMQILGIKTTTVVGHLVGQNGKPSVSRQRSRCF